MSLKVKCPKGCKLRVPNRRNGTVIRCPKCRAIIRVPSTEGMPEGGELISLNATLVSEVYDPSQTQDVSQESLRDQWRADLDTNQVVISPKPLPPTDAESSRFETPFRIDEPVLAEHHVDEAAIEHQHDEPDHSRTLEPTDETEQVTGGYVDPQPMPVNEQPSPSPLGDGVGEPIASAAQDSNATPPQDETPQDDPKKDQVTTDVQSDLPQPAAEEIEPSPPETPSLDSLEVEDEPRRLARDANAGSDSNQLDSSLTAEAKVVVDPFEPKPISVAPEPAPPDSGQSPLSNSSDLTAPSDVTPSRDIEPVTSTDPSNSAIVDATEKRQSRPPTVADESRHAEREPGRVVDPNDAPHDDDRQSGGTNQPNVDTHDTAGDKKTARDHERAEGQKRTGDHKKAGNQEQDNHQRTGLHDNADAHTKAKRQSANSNRPQESDVKREHKSRGESRRKSRKKSKHRRHPGANQVSIDQSSKQRVESKIVSASGQVDVSSSADKKVESKAIDIEIHEDVPPPTDTPSLDASNNNVLDQAEPTTPPAQAQSDLKLSHVVPPPLAATEIPVPPPSEDFVLVEPPIEADLAATGQINAADTHDSKGAFDHAASIAAPKNRSAGSLVKNSDSALAAKGKGDNANGSASWVAHRDPDEVTSSNSTSDDSEPTETVGLVPDFAKQQTSRAMAMVMVMAGLFTMGPSIFDLAMGLQEGPLVDVERWVFVLFFLGGVHFLYATYLAQLPDWSSMWVASILMLVLTCFDALCLGGLFIGNEEGPVANALQITTDRRSQAMLWMLCMMSIHGLLSYFCGREASRWKNTFDVFVSTLD